MKSVLFIALALSTAAFTFAGSMLLVPYPSRDSDMAWLQIMSGKDSHTPEVTLIRTTAIPTVKRIAPTIWMITFRSTTNNQKTY